ncbi:unnamed protein product [Rotaria magnacalcarata]|uniref:Uncharacterized protein n=2 Tax=Rotaria magnacalcarata TaxID=392030 RepID=A0A814XPG2_9BILA|nr:unnamed protein product [Rotaria magnacalcarata]
MSDFYQLTTSTSDFKSRSKDVFEKLTTLEKQHDVHIKTNSPLSVPDEETPSSSHKNPNIPNNAITFKKRAADDTFIRPEAKWKKYDLDDVNEHHLSGVGNQHALNDFLRTRVKSSNKNESVQKEDEDEETPVRPIFQRPTKKQIRTNDTKDTDDDINDDFISFRVPAPPNATETKTGNDDDDDDKTIEYKLKSNSNKPRGVFSTNEKKSIKPANEILQEKDNDDDDHDDEVDDEIFEP